MVGLKMPPLRGLITFWFASGYNLVIPSGLRKMTLKENNDKHTNNHKTPKG